LADVHEICGMSQPIDPQQPPPLPAVAPKGPPPLLSLPRAVSFNGLRLMDLSTYDKTDVAVFGY